MKLIDIASRRTVVLSLLVCAAYATANSLLLDFSLFVIIATAVVWVAFCLSLPLRQFLITFLPFMLFGAIYDFMRLYPNYLVNPIDIVGLYEAEKSLFGIATASGTLIPCEFFKLYHWPVADLLSGIFYLCWVPLPILYGFYLYFTGRRGTACRFASAFLFVNLIGFAGYYIHPAAPPWYVMDYGFVPDFSVGGNVAGFLRFDQLVGAEVFQSIYGKNSNVFAAVPSLHSAYVPVALYYAIKDGRSRVWIALLAMVSAGIWFSAVYSGHHYIIDVLLGISCTLLGLLLFEGIVMRLPFVRRLATLVNSYISGHFGQTQKEIKG